MYTVRFPWDKSDMTLVLRRYRTSFQSLEPAALGIDIRRYLPRTRVISYTSPMHWESSGLRNNGMASRFLLKYILS